MRVQLLQEQARSFGRSEALRSLGGNDAAIVRDVVDIYGGTVELEESEDLGGLLVRLRLPKAAG